MLLAVSAVLESECCFLLTLGLMTDPKLIIIVLNRTTVLILAVHACMHIIQVCFGVC